MRVLQINAVYNTGSTGRATAELHKALAENGIDSYVAYSKTNNADGKNLYRIGSALDVKLHGLLSRLSGKQAYFSRFATKRLIDYMDEIKPDVVHFGNLHGNYINLPMLMKYLSKKGISVVITFHDFWFITGKCVHFTSSGCDKWQTHCENCPNLQSGNPTWFFDRTKTLFSDKQKMFLSLKKLSFVGVSEWVTDQLRKSPLSQNADTVTIYNWIDFEKFYPRQTDNMRKKLGLKDKFTVVGVSSVWQESKGFDSFIKLAREMPEITVVLVGKIEGNPSLPENIKAVGQTENVGQLAEIYSAADAFVTFSLEETFGLVSAEALSCGTPVICYDSTANREIVGEGCGYVCEKRNFAQVVEALNEVKCKGKNFYSDKCVEFAHENFDKEKNINKYIELYKKSVNGNG